MAPNATPSIVPANDPPNTSKKRKRSELSNSSDSAHVSTWRKTKTGLRTESWVNTQPWEEDKNRYLSDVEYLQGFLGKIQWLSPIGEPKFHQFMLYEMLGKKNDLESGWLHFLSKLREKAPLITANTVDPDGTLKPILARNMKGKIACEPFGRGDSEPLPLVEMKEFWDAKTWGAGLGDVKDKLCAGQTDEMHHLKQKCRVSIWIAFYKDNHSDH